MSLWLKVSSFILPLILASFRITLATFSAHCRTFSFPFESVTVSSCTPSDGLRTLAPLSYLRADSTILVTSRSDSGGSHCSALVARQVLSITLSVSPRACREQASLWMLTFRFPLPTLPGITNLSVCSGLSESISFRTTSSASAIGYSSGSYSHSYDLPLGWTEGGAMIYPPSDLMSTPSSRLTLFLLVSPLSLYSRWLPPLPVIDRTVSGSVPFSRSHSFRESAPLTPLSFSSTSTTSRYPETSPQAIPMLADGCLVHHFFIVSKFVVASCTPFLVIGSFPFGLQGNTARPLLA